MKKYMFIIIVLILALNSCENKSGRRTPVKETKYSHVIEYYIENDGRSVFIEYATVDSALVLKDVLDRGRIWNRYYRMSQEQVQQISN